MELNQDQQDKELITPPVEEKETLVAEEEKEEEKPNYPWWDFTQGKAATAYQAYGDYINKVSEGNVTGGDRGKLFGSLMHLGFDLALPTHLDNTAALGTIKAIGNATKAVTDMRKGDYTDYEIGRGADEFVEEAYKIGGFKPPSEMTAAEKNGDDMRSALMLNIYLAFLTRGVGNIAGSQIPAVAKLMQGLDPTKAKTFMGALGRLGAINAIDEVPSTFLDDNRNNFGTKPGMSMTEASQAAFPYNLGLSSLAALGLNAKQIKGLFSNVQRAKTSETLTNFRRMFRDQQKADNIITEDAGGKVSFTKTVDPEGTNAEKITPQTPESDSVQEALENLDDTQIAEVAQAENNIAEVIEEVSKRAGDGDQQLLKYSDVSAPTNSLAITDINTRINQVPTDNLLSLANPKNGTELSDAITEATGKEFEQFTRQDVVSGIKK